MSKDLYRKLCSEEESIPVFSRDWWLDAACGETMWDALVVEDKGNVLAAMPLFVPCKGVVSMPNYTQSMGIWFAPEPFDMKYSSCLERRQNICGRLIENLKPYKSFMQNFSHEFTDWLPFYWAGYSQTTRYTYILENLKNTSRIFENMSQQIRRNIKRAEERKIIVKGGVSVEDFISLQTLTFKRQGKKNKQSPDVLRRLIEMSRKRGQGDVYGGYDEEGRLHAAAFIVWQKSSAYYIAGGGDPVLRSSGAHSLVLWEAIKKVSEYTDTFDFEGSMIPGVERFFREFGARQIMYFQISRGKLSLFDKVSIKMKMFSV